MKENVLIAFAFDGMRNIYEKEVKRISVWIDNKCDHSINDKSVSALIKQANKSGKMQIYISDYENLDGEIDAFGGTPLYTNGQFSVNRLMYNGTNVWSKLI